MKLVDIIKKIRISSLTVPTILKENNQTTIRNLNRMWRGSVLADVKPDVFADKLRGLIKKRNRSALTDYKNIMSSARGQFRSVASRGKFGKWENVGVFDSAQTSECAEYLGESWRLPYSQIPNKPPRIANTPHPCRSYLLFVEDGVDEAMNQDRFITQWNNSSDDTKLSMLGRSRFEAWKNGTLIITSFSQYEKTQLFTLEEQGLKDGS